MSRGFAIGVNVATADDLTNERIADEVASNGQLTALEMTTFLPAALAAAKGLMSSLANGPFWVWLDGNDNFATAGETTTLRVMVSTFATPPVAGAAPEVVHSVPTEAAAPAPEDTPEVVAEPAPEPEAVA